MSKGSFGRRRSALLVATSIATVCVATQALAGAFALREQSATGQGASFAGIAAGGGDSISGMFWNPAVVNQVVGYQGEQHVTGVFPSSTIDVSQGTKNTINAVTGGFGASDDAGDIGQSAVLATGYNAYRINEQVAVGLVVSTPFGLVTDPRNDWAGQVYGRSSKVFSVNVSPTVGYQVNEWLSVAVGAQIQYFDISLRQASGILAGAGSVKLSGDDIGYGFTAGMTLKPMDGTEIGVGFRSHISHSLKGEVRRENGGGAVTNNNISADIGLPETVTVGVRQRVTDAFTLLAGGEWTNWSRFNTFDVKLRGGPGSGTTVTQLPFEYDDGWFASVGGEYAVSQELTLRAGVAYEWSPISDEVRTVRLPDNNRWWLSTGLSYAYSDKLAFDLGYSYVFVPGKSKIEVDPGDADALLPFPFSAKAESDVHIVSASVRYKFGGEPEPALVTKY